MGNNGHNGSCSALPMSETLLSSTDYVLPNRAYNGSLLPGRVTVAN